MAQTWTSNTYQIDHIAATDLQNIENNFATLKSLFSGAGSPASAVAGMPWFDTTDKVLKIRNQANSAWLGVMYGNSATPIWMYVDAAPDGWALAGALTDKVLAIKGGSTYVTGGATAGSWTQPTHTLSVAEMPSHNHTGSTNTTGAHTHTLTADSVFHNGGYGGWGNYDRTPYSNTTSSNGNHSHTLSIGSKGGGGAHSHGTTYRPTAAVGILVAPDA